ncbi:hypothetical protein KH5H1_46080 [Corallococcus caeni]|uniref:Uncharacterized protein n=1 Tax=Corallococcus caeni TaxID=3082388 RepID=A0ABQ6QLC9_9BACT|nr:hypothetical protein KH5H1_46080 [Corallococcus sp. KH5-1]GMU04819.1 hypothetical protein ASNO1_10710 [Corallococcus sp. NO1]
MHAASVAEPQQWEPLRGRPAVTVHATNPDTCDMRGYSDLLRQLVLLRKQEHLFSQVTGSEGAGALAAGRGRSRARCFTPG